MNFVLLKAQLLYSLSQYSEEIAFILSSCPKLIFSFPVPCMAPSLPQSTSFKTHYRSTFSPPCHHFPSHPTMPSPAQMFMPTSALQLVLLICMFNIKSLLLKTQIEKNSLLMLSKQKNKEIFSILKLRIFQNF